MASINSIEVKALKTFLDHEGAPICQGNVYYKGKKLGFWSQDSWGGPDIYDFNEEILKDEVERAKKSSLVEERYRDIFDLDILMYELCKLADSEKAFKKCLKNGYKRYVEVGDGIITSGYFTCSEEPLKEPFHHKFIKRTFKRPIEFENVYGSLDDFKINV